MKKQRKNKICKNTHQKGENSVKKEEKKEKTTKKWYIRKIMKKRRTMKR